MSLFESVIIENKVGKPVVVTFLNPYIEDSKSFVRGYIIQMSFDYAKNTWLLFFSVNF